MDPLSVICPAILSMARANWRIAPRDEVLAANRSPSPNPGLSRGYWSATGLAAWPVASASGCPAWGGGGGSRRRDNKTPRIADAPPSPAAAATAAGDRFSRARTHATQSTVSASAEPSSQPRTGFPRSSAITVPSPSATSRPPSMRANTGVIPSDPRLRDMTRAARPGVSTAATPIAIRQRASDMASVASSIAAIVSRLPSSITGCPRCPRQDTGPEGHRRLAADLCDRPGGASAAPTAADDRGDRQRRGPIGRRKAVVGTAVRMPAISFRNRRKACALATYAENALKLSMTISPGLRSVITARVRGEHASKAAVVEHPP
jgi:hypothetical protein